VNRGSIRIELKDKSQDPNEFSFSSGEKSTKKTRAEAEVEIKTELHGKEIVKRAESRKKLAV
jgi:hypothetical protein